MLDHCRMSVKREHRISRGRSKYMIVMQTGNGRTSQATWDATRASNIGRIDFMVPAPS